MWESGLVQWIQEHFLIQIILFLVGSGVALYAIVVGLINWDTLHNRFLGIKIVLGLFLIGAVVMPKINKNETHDEMMQSCFEVVPSLETTLDNLQAEILKWEESKNEVARMRDATKTNPGRLLGDRKLEKIESQIEGLKKRFNEVLAKVEIIAIESSGSFTELDKKALEDLEHKVDVSVADAQDLMKEFAESSSLDEKAIETNFDVQTKAVKAKPVAISPNRVSTHLELTQDQARPSLESSRSDAEKELALGSFPETRRRLLRSEDCRDLDFAQTQLAINEMFARYGAVFGDKDLQQSFEGLSWYQPRSDLQFSQIEELFSDIEKANLLILSAHRNNLRVSRSGG